VDMKVVPHIKIVTAADMCPCIFGWFIAYSPIVWICWLSLSIFQNIAIIKRALIYDF